MSPSLASPLLAASLILAGCANPGSAPGSDAGTPARAITLDLRDASVQEVLETVSRAAEQPIVVDPDAQAVTRCARMTVLAPKPTSGAELARLVSDALEPTSLSLALAPGGWIVRRKVGLPLPASCEAPAAPSGAAEPTPPGADAGPSDIDRMLAGIRRVSEGEVQVTESARDAFFENAAAATATLRIMPSLRDGGLAGLKFFGIRPGDVLSALGFENGDTIVSIDKRPIGSPEAAVELTPQIRRSPRVTLQIERHGKRKDVLIRIVPDPRKPQPSTSTP